jgi:microcystin-dependent protein
MSNSYIAEIKIISFNFAPKGWALCNGQLLAISQNQALFSILGTTYGGNGTTNFALPNLQGRVPVHFGNGIVLGEAAGEENHTLTLPEMPAHTHQAGAVSGPASRPQPTGAVWAASGAFTAFSASPNTTMFDSTVKIGANQSHPNLPPYLTLNFVICLVGIFPSRS